MKFAKFLIQGVCVFFIITAFSLAGAITPQFTTLSNLVNLPFNLMLYIITVVILTTIGYFLGVGITAVKKNLESLGLAYGGSLVVGGILALMTVLKFPFSVQMNLYWLGTAWYDPWLLIFFVGTPIILTFVAC
jgi:hypothetical protein